jgi:phosphatidylinositol 4-kinase
MVCITTSVRPRLKKLFGWNLIRYRWTYGASRVQVDADIKLLNEFLESLQSDVVRGSMTVTSFEEPRSQGLKGVKTGNQVSILLRAFY